MENMNKQTEDSKRADYCWIMRKFIGQLLANKMHSHRFSEDSFLIHFPLQQEHKRIKLTLASK